MDGLEEAELFRPWLPSLALSLQRNKASPPLPPMHLCPEAVGSRVLRHSCRSCADISRMRLTTTSHGQSQSPGHCPLSEPLHNHVGADFTSTPSLRFFLAVLEPQAAFNGILWGPGGQLCCRLYCKTCRWLGRSQTHSNMNNEVRQGVETGLKHLGSELLPPV